MHRCISDSTIWKEKPFSRGQAWVDLLMLANFKDDRILVKGKIVEIPRGSFLTTDDRLVDRWGWSRNKVRAYLALLVQEGMIEKKGTPQGTALTIVKYGFYQDWESTDGTPKGITQSTTKGITESISQGISESTTESTHNKKDNKEKESSKKEKNVKKEKKPPIVYFPNDEKLNQSFVDFINHRKKLKAPMTEEAVKRAINKLEKLSVVNGVMDNDLAIEIIDQSIVNGWKGLFELQNYKSKTNSRGNQGVDWEELRRQAAENDRQDIESGAMNIDGTRNY